jgi:hypothetical protein
LAGKKIGRDVMINKKLTRRSHIVTNVVFSFIKKKRVSIPVFIVLFAFVVLCFKPVYWNISRTMTVQIIENLNDGSAVEGEMIVKGTYWFYLLRPDVFEGRIEIAAFPETAEKNVELRVAEKLPDPLVYRSWDGSILTGESFGLIWAGVGMKKMIILKSDANGTINLDGEKTCVILAGDTTPNDAWKLLKSLQQLSE